MVVVTKFSPNILNLLEDAKNSGKNTRLELFRGEVLFTVPIGGKMVSVDNGGGLKHYYHFGYAQKQRDGEKVYLNFHGFGLTKSDAGKTLSLRVKVGIRFTPQGGIFMTIKVLDRVSCANKELVITSEEINSPYLESWMVLSGGKLSPTVSILELSE